jgi:hypothetical protein
MTVPTLVAGLNALLLLVLMVVCRTEASNLQLAWEPLPSQIAGYKLHGEIRAIFVLPFPPLQRAIHSEECDARPLACVPMPWIMAAGLPDTQSTS